MGCVGAKPVAFPTAPPEKLSTTREPLTLASTLSRSFSRSWLKFSDPEIRSVSEPSTTPSRP